MSTHINLRQKAQTQSVFNQSEAPSLKQTSMSHQCEYYFAVQKANKIINRKNREVETLNRIIQNLKQEMAGLNNYKNEHQAQTQALKNQLAQLKAKISQYQLKQLQNQRLIYQQRLQSAIKVKNNSSRIQNKPMREYLPQYYSQCHMSRHTEEQRIPNIQNIQVQRMYEKPSNFVRTPKQSSNSLTMGQLFMGRKLKIEMNNKINKHSSWGQVQLLNQSKRMPSQRNFERDNFLKGNYFNDPTKMSVEQALNYLKNQNQNLKLPVY